MRSGGMLPRVWVWRKGWRGAQTTACFASSSSSSSRCFSSQGSDNAIIYRKKDQGQASAKARAGALSGWATTIKDNICTTDMPTACASRMLDGYMSPFDATVVSLLRNAGANIIGKTNCDEFGMGSANLNSLYGPVINPASPPKESHVAGGSSGGAAASVASGEARLAIGTDTGGSVRLPAAYCGVLGLKPSYGLISRWGLVAYADSLDTVGLMARDPRDLQSAFDAVARFDDCDPTSISNEIRSQAHDMSQRLLDNLQGGNGSLQGLRVGVPQEFFAKEVQPRVYQALREALATLRDAGAEIKAVSLPDTKFAFSAYYVIASAEASSNLARYDGIRYGHRADPPNPLPHDFAAQVARTRSEGFGSEVQKRLLLGTYALTSELFDNYYLRAQEARQLVRSDFDAAFACLPNVLGVSRRPGHPASHSEGSGNADELGVHVLVHPSAVDIAHTIEEAGRDGLQSYTQDLLSVPASLAGVPSVTMPMGLADGLPVGVTVTTQWGCEPILWRLLGHLQNSSSSPADP